MPRQVVQSPFHPQHILLPRRIQHGYSLGCSACRNEIEGISFYCNQCDVNLHVSCAKYRTRAIKHNCHPHHLLHLGKSIISEVSCNVCHKDCDDSFFGCIKCEFYIHVECIPLPPRADQHTHHLHPLMLTNPVVEDDSGEYYCDACETERNGEHHVYYCEECKYIAHIGCVLSEVEATKEMFMDQRTRENADKAVTTDKIMDGKRVELERTSVRYEELAFVGQRIQKDSFHPHPLTLNADAKAVFACNGCGELCRGLSYNCSICLFNLDLRCADLDDDLAKHEAIKGREIITTIHHFSHNHQLTRCKIDRLRTEIDVRACVACRQHPYGLVYICIPCQFILHESCLEDLVMEVQSPFHPQHPLRALPIPSGFGGPSCVTCRQGIAGIVFTCFECNVAHHYSCAKYQTRKIKHNCHDHHLLQLGKSIFVGRSPLCNACGDACRDTLFCCIDCDFHIHLECIPLPCVIKHIRHLHPLTLTHSVVEDNFGEYVCDMCETSRNPEHDVYYCKECTYVAHIDCVLSEVEPPEKKFDYLVPRRPRSEGLEIFLTKLLMMKGLPLRVSLPDIGMVDILLPSPRTDGLQIQEIEEARDDVDVKV
ncbi:hypothetical protein PTKIN_Ptkin01aG0348100 [Pterospermum kingtungense]